MALNGNCPPIDFFSTHRVWPSCASTTTDCDVRFTVYAAAAWYSRQRASNCQPPAFTIRMPFWRSIRIAISEGSFWPAALAVSRMLAASSQIRPTVPFRTKPRIFLSAILNLLDHFQIFLTGDVPVPGRHHVLLPTAPEIVRQPGIFDEPPHGPFKLLHAIRRNQ
jgi:hypothetical protein